MKLTHSCTAAAAEIRKTEKQIRTIRSWHFPEMWSTQKHRDNASEKERGRPRTANENLSLSISLGVSEHICNARAKTFVIRNECGLFFTFIS